MKINDPNGENIIYINERLRNKIDKIPLYDITVIDAPAGYGKTEAASFFSKEHKDEVIVPVKVDEDALEGLDIVTEQIEDAKAFLLLTGFSLATPHNSRLTA